MRTRRKHGKVFIFKKSQGPLKNIFLKVCRNLPYTVHQWTIVKKIKIKIYLVFFYFPKMGKMVFDLQKGKLIFFQYLFIFSFYIN